MTRGQAAVAVSLLCAALAGGCAAHESHVNCPAAPQLPAAKNPVQAEMRLLSEAMQSAVRGVGSGDVRPVLHDLHRVHAAKAATSAALAGGEYRPPKHPEQLEAFHALDEVFHTQLEQLVDASRKNDVPAAAAALGAAMQSCQGCHQQFR